MFDTHDALLEHDLGSVESKAHAERAPVTMLPIAMTAIVCLLLGFGAGYVVGGRSGDPAETVGSQAQPPSSEPGPAGTTSPPARDLTEQPIGPAPAPAPEAPRAATPAPADAAPAARRGRIMVRSTPTGAGVTVNGNWRGRTPLEIDNLAFGKYAIRVVQRGYQTAREDVALSASSTSRTLSVRLNRQAGKPAGEPLGPVAKPAAGQTFTGSVFVDSRPRGAKVMLDGKEFGTTPLRIPDVPVGSHVIRLELADHRSWTNSISVTAGKATPVTGSLEPIR